jgi:ABC-2 type transport system permease protein
VEDDRCAHLPLHLLERVAVATHPGRSLGSAVGALSIAIAIVVRREESVIGVMQMLLRLMTFLASVFMARELMPGWIQDIACFNPVDWAAGAGREAVSADVDWSLVLSHGAYLVAFALLSAWVATRGFRA